MAILLTIPQLQQSSNAHTILEQPPGLSVAIYQLEHAARKSFPLVHSIAVRHCALWNVAVGQGRSVKQHQVVPMERGVQHTVQNPTHMGGLSRKETVLLYDLHPPRTRTLQQSNGQLLQDTDRDRVPCMRLLLQCTRQQL